MDRPFKLTLAALGGQGGGVLADWLIEIAEAEGYLIQTTSVPGVAQRTGATIYYVEFFPKAAADAAGREPVMALMPVPGDVDCVVASELAEAGRSIQRGLVTPDRTTLIASTHRSYTISEKSAMGTGAVDQQELLNLVQSHAKKLILFDMAEMAERHHSVISSVMLGAICGSGVTPFKQASFEAAIQKSGIAVKTNLAAFEGARLQAVNATAAASSTAVSPAAGEAAAVTDSSLPTLPPGVLSASGESSARAQAGSTALSPPAAGATAASANNKPLRQGPENKNFSLAAQTSTAASNTRNAPPLRSRSVEVTHLLERTNNLPSTVRPIAIEGIRRTVDYQDPKYAALFLERVEHVAKRSQDANLLEATARGLALWMSFEDTIRVADLKTRGARFQRVRNEVQAQPNQILGITEFLKPGIDEITGTLPRALGAKLRNSKRATRWLERWTEGKKVRTATLSGFLTLYTLAGLQRWRRGTLRYYEENERIEYWLSCIERALASNPALAVEVARAQRLVKGYGETYERGWGNFKLLMAQLDRLAPRADGAEVMASLQKAALADDEGRTLARALAILRPETVAA